MVSTEDCSKGVVGKIDVSELMDGKCTVFDLVSLDSIFKFDESEYTIAKEDKGEMETRRQTLNAQFRDACTSMFADALSKANIIREEQAKHVA
eukprot:2727252-Pyramimonas_sp.AAC.1